MELHTKNMKKIMLLIAFGVGLLFLTQHIEMVFTVFKAIISLLFPFLLGLCIAFIVNVPMSLIERKLFKKKNSKTRTISILLAYLLLIVLIGFVLLLVIPDFIKAFTTLIDRLPEMLENIGSWMTNFIHQYPNLQSQIEAINWIEVGANITEILKNNIGGVLNNSLSLISSFVSGVLSFIMGIVFSIYILSQKELLANQVKKVMAAYGKKNINHKIIEVATISNKTFTKFITGQCLEACILGSLFFITMSIFRLPYALAISALITVTALIPIFGAMIAMVLGVVLIASTNPIQAVWFVILFFVLQQVEGNFIYPKVVGKSVGLPGLWVMLAVMVGGSAFGLVGMLVSVPISSILYSVFRDFVNDRIAKKGVKTKEDMI